MKVVVITGSGGLIGSEAVEFYADKAEMVVGIDNNMRADFFGEEASTTWRVDALREKFPNYEHFSVDIRDMQAIEKIFSRYGKEISLVIHTAAQPSHDWAASDPLTDFTVNANGTLTLLEAVRSHCHEAVFIFTSTNKVYGDRPNTLPLVEKETRWEVSEDHPYFAHGIDEEMSIDMSKHSLFGASKVAADVLVQEYGRYFGMKTVSFRGGCLAGPAHSGTMLHGFLSYLMKCVMTGTTYTVFGYKGKQIRDNIHSYDLIQAFDRFYNAPRIGEVYNIGGGRFSSCSILEAIDLCQEIVGKKLKWSLSEDNRIGDHIWWISDTRKFAEHYPGWKHTFDVPAILRETYTANIERWRS